MYCTECGNKNEDADNYCASCGAKMLGTGTFSEAASAPTMEGSGTYWTPYASAPSAYVLEPTPILPVGPTVLDKQKRSLGLVLASTALCVFLFIFSIISLVLVVIRVSVSEQSIIETVSELNIDVLMNRFDIYGIIEEHAGREVLDDYGLSQGTIERLLELRFVQDYVSETVSGYIEAFARGDTAHNISKSSLLRLLERNATQIERVTGHRITEMDIRDIEDYLDESGILKETSIDSIIGNASISPSLFQWPLSQFTLVVSFLLCALIMAGLFLINRMYLRLAFRDAGITIGAAGLLLFVLGLLLYILINSFAGNAIGQVLIRNFFAKFRNTMLISGLFALLAGLLLFAVNTLIAFISKRKINSDQQENPQLI